MNHNINEQIEAVTVRVVTEDGVMKGEMGFSEALELAKKQGLDLVQVSPGDNPICKIFDYNVMKYKDKKKKQGSKPAPSLKQIRVSYGISNHDLKTKRNHTISLLRKKHKVKYILRLKGRERGLKENALNKMKEISESFSGQANQSEINVSAESSSVVLSLMLSPIS